MAVAALEEQVVTPETLLDCPGVLVRGGHEFKDWEKGGHGEVNLHKALVESCDVYFYLVGERLGIDRIAKWSRRFGLDNPAASISRKRCPGWWPPANGKRPFCTAAMVAGLASRRYLTCGWD